MILDFAIFVASLRLFAFLFWRITFASRIIIFVRILQVL
jgi:hypothetical protein